jgi:hypothetical protein
VVSKAVRVKPKMQWRSQEARNVKHLLREAASFQERVHIGYRQHGHRVSFPRPLQITSCALDATPRRDSWLRVFFEFRGDFGLGLLSNAGTV